MIAHVVYGKIFFPMYITDMPYHMHNHYSHGNNTDVSLQ